jgi:hypothetical protein
MLISSNRRLVKEGPVYLVYLENHKESVRERTWFLFNDLIIMTSKKKGNGTYKFLYLESIGTIPISKTEYSKISDVFVNNFFQGEK